MWMNLRKEIDLMFSRLPVYVPDAGGTRFFRVEDPADAVERVRRWRRTHRAQRNATARAAYARNAIAAAKYQRDWQARRKAGLS